MEMDSEKSQVTINELRVEFVENPLGIDTRRPRFSWVLEAIERGLWQKAYQVMVSKDPDLSEGDIWDSGKIASCSSIHIEYDGTKLKPDTTYYWKVRIWDNHDRVSEWSETAYWSMGILDDSDWKAKWIGGQERIISDDMARLSFNNVHWIQSEENSAVTSGLTKEQRDKLMEGVEVGKTIDKSSSTTRFFRYSWDIPVQTIKKAKFLFVADHTSIVYLNGHFIGRSSMQNPALLDLTYELKSGLNTLATVVTNDNYPPAILGKLIIEFENKEQMVIETNDDWKVSFKEELGWETIDFNDTHWLGIHKGKLYEEDTRGKDCVLSPDLYKILYESPNPYLRKEFTIQKPVKRAVIYATSLGLYELMLNGEMVDHDLFKPGWTDYNTRLQYQTYDLTDKLKQGTHVLGALLGVGWYAGHVGMFTPYQYGNHPYLLAQLSVEYTDGSSETIVTDESWKTFDSPILSSDIIMGETYDARNEINGWAMPGFDDSGWNKPSILNQYKGGKLVSQVGPPVQITEYLKPISVHKTHSGSYVFDMGQNMVGYVRLKIRGKAGQKIILKFAEMIHKDGTLYTENLRNAKQRDIYIVKGEKEEEYQPHFTFHGFQYVEVTGYTEELGLDDVIACVIHSATPPAGQLETSDEMVNKLISNIRWGQRDNFLSIPTDCPQRDERLGWTGDGQVFMRTASYNYDVSGFFIKWMQDIVDAQRDSGSYTDIAPYLGFVREGTAGWGDAGIIVPWTLYKVYGDQRVIENHYKSMTKWIEYLQTNSDRLIRPKFGYGDWLQINTHTPKEVVSTAFFAYSAKLLSEMAAIIGKSEDAEKYRQLFEDIRRAFNEAFVDEDGRIEGNTQACYVFSLHMDLLLDENMKQLAVKHLVDDIKANDWHLSTGFLAVGYLLPILTEYGYDDVAYRLLHQDTFPSWGYSIKHGATTIWERWDGWTDEKGFQDSRMNSFNHYSLGSVGEWLYRYVLGIDTESNSYGYKEMKIHPRPGGKLTYAKGSFKTIHGEVKSEWKLEDHQFFLNVSIPANTTANVYIKAEDLSTIYEGGRPVIEIDEIAIVGHDGENMILKIGSGDYQFQKTLNEIIIGSVV